MSFLLFQVSLILYLLATAAYLVFFFKERAAIRKNARLLFILAFALHSITIIVRYFEAGYTPITTRHETISFFAWSLGCCYLSFCWRYGVKNLGAFVSLLVLTLMSLAAFAPRATVSLSPQLQSGWLPVHASLSLLAYGFFALAGVGGLMYLLQERTIKRKRFGLFYSRLPSLEALDTLNHHCLSVGFPLLTLGMITGSLWAKQALGSYWRWDPMETWTLITWLLYAALIHQRFTVGWRGRQAALLSIAALVVALFTFWGVSVFFTGYHGSFS
ncbi:MAG: c-type cytochrome biogenesis protein CcsB [Desulfobulbaceae bacterium]|nr:c-type cytochrome biogenesis protein CcsB [Desulfobulbaceae bacterium]